MSLDKIFTWFRIKKEMLERMFFWGWKLRYSYDFDFNGHYTMLYHKLDRCYICFRDHSHLMWNRHENTVGMRKLRVARECARRLDEDFRFCQHYELHNKKWGEATWEFHPYTFDEKGKPLTYSSTSRRKNITPENEAQERKEFNRAIKKDSKIQQETRKMLYQLIEKYGEQWWD